MAVETHNLTVDVIEDQFSSVDTFKYIRQRIFNLANRSCCRLINIAL